MTIELGNDFVEVRLINELQVVECLRRHVTIHYFLAFVLAKNRVIAVNGCSGLIALVPDYATPDRLNFCLLQLSWSGKHFAILPLTVLLL